MLHSYSLIKNMVRHMQALLSSKAK